MTVQRRYFTYSAADDVAQNSQAKKLSLFNSGTMTFLNGGWVTSSKPGDTRVGQYNPNANALDSVAAEIDRANQSAPNSLRSGWVTDSGELDGYEFAAGTTIDAGFRIFASGAPYKQKNGRFFCRITVVTCSLGTAEWYTFANLLDTSIDGEISHDAGQEGWRGATGTSLPLTSSTTAHSVSFSGNSTGHIFASGQRLLVELGYGNVNPTPIGNVQWRLRTDNDLMYIDLPLSPPTPPPATGSIQTSFLMRAKQISTSNYVYWTTYDDPDPSGSLSGIDPGDLSDTVVFKMNELLS